MLHTISNYKAGHLIAWEEHFFPNFKATRQTVHFPVILQLYPTMHFRTYLHIS